MMKTESTVNPRPSPIGNPQRGLSNIVLLVLIVVVAGVAAAVTGLLMNIFERKQEAAAAHTPLVEVTEDTTDPAKWGKNWPREYDDYKRTVDQVRTKYGGSEALPRTPTAADPRSVVAQSKIEEDPRRDGRNAEFP